MWDFLLQEMMAVKVYIVSKKEVGIINYWDEKPQ